MPNSQDVFIFALFIVGPLLILSLLYVFFAIFSFNNWKIIKNAINSNKIGYCFYLGICILCIFRIGIAIYMTFYTVLEIKNLPTFKEKVILYFTLNYIPDILFWNLFFLLFWQLLATFYSGHAFRDNVWFNGQGDQVNFPLQPKQLYYLICILFTATVYQSIMIILMNSWMISIFTFLLINACFHLVTPLIYLIGVIYLHVKFSGIPYRSVFSQENKANIIRTLTIWSITRGMHSTIDFLIFLSKPNIVKGKLSFDQGASEYALQIFLYILIIVGEKLGTEILPFFSVFMLNCNQDLQNNLLDEDKKDIDLPNVIYIKPLTSTNENKEDDNSSVDSLKASITKKILKKIPIEEIHFNPNLKPKMRFCGLGELKIGYIEQNPFFKICARQINLKDVTSYVSDEIKKDLQNLYLIQTLNSNVLVNIIGYSFEENNCIYFIYEYLETGNLFDYLHQSYSKKKSIDENARIKLSLNIARVINTLHTMDPPICHGHLTPYNILFDKEMNPKIGDLLFHTFKKYTGLVLGYNNKSQYTAPEFLIQKGNVISKPNIKGDIYSFGIILWEIFTEKIPFENIEGKKYSNLISENQQRPKIPEFISEEIATLIRMCWQQNPSLRPNFVDIINLLEEYSAKITMNSLLIQSREEEF